MKPVLLLAYTNLNFGDDMFIKTICSNYPEINFELEAPYNYKNIMSSISNLKIISHKKIYKMLEKIDSFFLRVLPLNVGLFRYIWLRKYIAVVYVIGGLFDDDDLWRQQLNLIGKRRYRNAILKKSLCKKPPFYLLGCNMTRVNSEDYIRLMQYIFKDIKDVCFRDKYSFNKFCLKNTRYAPDLVFNYPISYYLKSKKIVISVWGCLTKCDELPQWKWAEHLWNSYKRFIVEIIKYFYSINYQVILLSLCENEGDYQACRIIEDEAKIELPILNYNGDSDVVVRCVSEASFVVGTRFHSVILALSSKTPVYPIVYESKTSQLLYDCNFKNEYSDILNIKEDELNKVINSFNKQHTFDEINDIKEKAHGQFAELDKLLRRDFYNDYKKQ